MIGRRLDDSANAANTDSPSVKTRRALQTHTPPWHGITCDSASQITLIDLGFNNGLTLPLGGMLPQTVRQLCFGSQVTCRGFPPQSCEVFGPDARMSFDPNHLGECLSCEGVNRSLLWTIIIVVSILVVVFGIIYVFLVTIADDQAFKGWIATVSIVLVYASLILVFIGAIVIAIAAPLVRRVFMFLRLIYLDLGGAQLECLLPQGQTAMPYLVVALAVLLPVLVIVALIASSQCAEADDDRAYRLKLAVTVFSVSFSSLPGLGISIVALGDTTFTVIGALLITFEGIGLLVVMALFAADSEDEIISYITRKYKRDAPYWQFVEWMRYVASAIAFAANSASAMAQATWLIGLDAIYLLFLIAVRPYDSNYQNVSAIWMAATIVICFGIAMANAGMYLHCFDENGDPLPEAGDDAFKETAKAALLCTAEDIHGGVLSRLGANWTVPGVMNNAAGALGLNISYHEDAYVGTPSELRTGVLIIVLLLLPLVGMPCLACGGLGRTGKRLLSDD